jgi:hypothetical protein
MTIRTRETLKKFFKEGQRPSEDHFADLVDSMLNMSDEGFRKTVENGQELSTPEGRDALLSFFRSQNQDAARWSVGFSRVSDQLLIQQGPAGRGGESAPDTDPGAASAPLLCLDPSQRIGVGEASPKAELDVAGSVRSRGRLGSFPLNPAPALADGKWHNLTGELAGCQAFEVMAGVSQRGSGRVALMHAVALNAYNPSYGFLNFLNRKRGIRCTHAYYSRRVDRLQLRWQGSSGKNAGYRLQIRTGCVYGKAVEIQAQLTQLWNNPHLDAPNP